MSDSGPPRLTGTAPQLAKLISDADPARQRDLALAAVEFAYSVSPHQDGGREALDAIRARQYGDTPLSQWLRREFRAAMVGSAQADEAGDSEAALAYNSHRHALAAAHYALYDNPEEAALEAVYEARFNARPRERFDDIVEATLR